MYCYDIGGHLAASLLPGLPLEPAQLPACGFPPLFLLTGTPTLAAPPGGQQTPGS